MILVLVVLFFSKHIFDAVIIEAGPLRHEPVEHNGQTLCEMDKILNGTWVFEGEESSSYESCPKAEILSKSIDEASYVCKKYRAAEFNRNSNCAVLSYESVVPVLLEKYAAKDIYFIGDSLGTQQYLAANCDFEKVNATMKIYFLGEPTFLPDVPCDIRCKDEGGVFRRHWASVHPRICQACQVDGWPIVYNINNVTNSWMRKLNLSSTAAVIMNSGVWYNWLHGYGRFPVNSFDSTTIYIRMIEHITPALKQIVARGVKLFWVGIPTIPQNDGNRKRKNIDWEYYSSKNLLAKKMIDEVGGVFLDIADVTAARKDADDLITIDGYHWCNPGRTAVTSFINQMLFHMLAVDILREDKNNFL